MSGWGDSLANVGSVMKGAISMIVAIANSLMGALNWMVIISVPLSKKRLLADVALKPGYALLNVAIGSSAEVA